MNYHSTNVNDIWNACLHILQDIVDERAYQTWFVPIVPVSIEGDTLTLQVPSQFFCEFLEGNFVEQLRTVLGRVIGPNASLQYNALVDNSSPKHPRTVTLAGCTQEGTTEQLEADQMRQGMPHTATHTEAQDFDTQLNSKLSFRNFYQSDCNYVARSVAEAIASSPGNTPMNPFFIYGPSGVGKTHLCHALGLRVRETHPRLKVLYVSSHLFEMQFTTAARAGTINDFIAFYQQVDVLIIDDIQWLIGKKKTQLAFFQVFNHLYMLSKQIVLTSDKPPVDLNGMEERLVTRMAGATCVKIERPDLRLRREILQQRTIQSGVSLDESVLNFIAENVCDNVRELEGTLVSLITNSVVIGKEIDLSFAKRIVRQAVRLEKKEVTVECIQQAVCKVFQVQAEQIKGKSRKQDIVQARQVIMFLSKKYTGQSLSAIGELMGGRNHATVLHGCRCVTNEMEMNASFRNTVERAEQMIAH
ncbi:chromosomal replication initiator protein DnaA [Porphyromonas loveana]|uniref:Chromosomal replication initiator protein DnaA n=1 Tax=Porphyromonas loveana TaxID=1884669 RepID=A0A2U1FSH8_9PORP|nr:chromosomal replication initiator protein DnaA [Porphyromonas loveana]PVZ15137.1 chromosomal replication initiator protein DnaA [Porphyromonas loveana]